MQLIGISGEYPSANLDCMIHGRYKERVIAGLKEDGYIKAYHKQNIYAYRLTKKGKEILLDQNKDRFDFFITDSNILKSDLVKRMRLHRIAEAYTIMALSDIEIFRDSKCMLFQESEFKQDRFQILTPQFFGSREIKELGPEMTKANNSRIVGILVTPMEYFLVYNTNTSVMKWQYKSEARMKALLEYHFNTCLKLKEYQNKEPSGIMIGRDMEMAYSLLTSTGGKNRTLFTVDTSFEHFYYVTNDQYGVLLLKFLSSHQRKEGLENLLSIDLKQLELQEQKSAYYHGLDHQNRPVFFAYSFDLVGIKKFTSLLNLRKTNGVILCFDFQKEVLQRYCGNGFEIQSIDSEKVRRRFLHEHE